MRTAKVIILASAFLLAAAVVGCANPADGKPEAAVSDPVEASAAGTEGTAETFVIGDGSTITWTGSKVTGSHEGGFNAFEGRIELIDGEPTKSSVAVDIDATSIWSDNERLTNHLKSEDFFEVDTYPAARFESTSIEAAADGYLVTGNLELHGVTKSIQFPARITVADDSVTAQAEFVIKRFDWDIVYKGKADDLIRDEVVINFDLVAMK